MPTNKYHVYCDEVPLGLVGGPFAVYVVKVTETESRVVTSCTFIRDAAHCNERAREYARSFSAEIINPITEAA